MKSPEASYKLSKHVPHHQEEKSQLHPEMIDCSGGSSPGVNVGKRVDSCSMAEIMIQLAEMGRKIAEDTNHTVKQAETWRTRRMGLRVVSKMELGSEMASAGQWTSRLNSSFKMKLGVRKTISGVMSAQSEFCVSKANQGIQTK